MRPFIVPAVLFVAALLAGCAKVAPQAGKVAVQHAEKSLAKAAPVGERAAGRYAAGAGAMEAAPAAGSIAKTAARRWAERIEKAQNVIEKAHEAYDILWEIVNAPPAVPQTTFPYSPSDVKPVSQQRIVVDRGSGGFVLPNNFGGFNFYTPDGQPLGFCAYNVTYGEMHFFSDKGVRVG